jgi:hypothetical protein
MFFFSAWELVGNTPQRINPMFMSGPSLIWKGYQEPQKGENHESSFGGRRPVSVGDRRHDIEQCWTFI